MKKLMLIMLYAVALCKAADDDYSSWERAVQPYQPIAITTELLLKNNKIQKIPALTLPQLQILERLSC